MLTRRDYVTFKQAQILKNLNFTNLCDHAYDEYGLWFRAHGDARYNKPEWPNTFFTPTYQELQRWLREAFEIAVWVEPNKSTDSWCGYIYTLDGAWMGEVYDSTYEAALSAAIDVALESLYKKKQ